MKTLTTSYKTISLLLCGGLIVSLYIYTALQNRIAEKHLIQNLQVSKADTNPHPFSIYTDVIIKFVPALKS